VLPLLVGSAVVRPPDALAAKGAAELDAGYYLKALLRGPEANRDDEFFLASPVRLAESARGAPDAAVAAAIVAGVLDAAATATATPLPAIRTSADALARASRAAELNVQTGTATFEYVRELSGAFGAARALVRTQAQRDDFERRLGCATLDAVLGRAPAAAAKAAALAPSAPARVAAAERALAALQRARLVESWSWLDAGSLAPLDNDAWAELAELDEAGAAWTVALEWRGSPSVGPCAPLVGSWAAALLPEPIGPAVACCLRAGAQCAPAPGGGGAAPPSARPVEWSMSFLESYRETTRIDVTKLSALMQVQVGRGAAA
jgi:hypothetical protein